ncbi:UNVERIFIED_CONTAM: hypothetical protein PYX00_007924 [Menopon gallinae]|uniref:Uncharacterized protein n=1 Tax=Menopon gallinae TaxID=328185 RepID=A0AAW2HL60_9NEOP
MESSRVVGLVSHDNVRRPESETTHKKKKKSTYQFYYWSSRRTSLQCYITITLGLPNLLQFTSAVEHYGGVIWIPYMLCIVMIGLPLVIAELALTHYINKEMIQAYEMSPLGLGVFINSLFATFCLTSFIHLFMVNSLSVTCEMEWGPQHNMDTIKSECLQLNGSAKDYCLSAAIQERQEANHMQFQNEWIPYVISTILSFCTFMVNRKGAASLQKYTIILVVVPYFCSGILLILLITLSDATNVMRRCFIVDWPLITDPVIWSICFQRAINGFSIANLGLTFASIHGDFHNDIMVDVVLCFLTQLLGTFIFSFIILGLTGVYNRGLKVLPLSEDFPDFMTLCYWLLHGLLTLPQPVGLWTFFFVTAIMVIAFGELCFMFAAVCDAVISLIPKLRNNTFSVKLFFALAFYLMGIGMISVSALLLLTITHEEPFDPMRNNSVLLFGIHVVIYLVIGLVQMLILKKNKENVNIFRANKNWGPADPLLKKSRLIFNSRVITEEHIYRQKLYKRQLAKPYDITNQNIVQMN